MTRRPARPAAAPLPGRPDDAASMPRISARSRREMAAAGITDPGLQAAYALARQLNARHGKTYYLATLLLPAAKRPYVHALYGFARYADDIVDNLDPALAPADKADRFDQWAGAFLAGLSRAESGDPVCRAVIDTIGHWQIPAEYFGDFLRSMRTDLTVSRYETFDDLCDYMWGSAAVIGLQMLPILGRANPPPGPEALRRAAIDLGLAFQLTNFLRDIGEDLDRGRIYLPQQSLRRFAVTPRDLLAARQGGPVTDAIRDLVAAEIARARGLYASAAAGIPLVDVTSRDCLHTALTLYSEILDGIEDARYDVFSSRVSVGAGRRMAVAGRGLARARAARRRFAAARQLPELAARSAGHAAGPQRKTP